jgi:site-specific recombinase XerD
MARPAWPSPLMPNFVSSIVSRNGKHQGLPKGASLHTVRHANLQLEKGVDIATVSERLCHSAVRTTADVYSHAIRGKDHAAALSWDAIMQRAASEKSTGVN